MKKRILSILLLCCMVLTLLPTAAFAAGEIDEQFTLAPGGTYYFDLSAMGIPGTVNDALPDKTMRYVPFTYAGTVDAYKLTSEIATTEEYAEQKKYPHSLFVADYAVAYAASWDHLNDIDMIFGKDYTAGGVDYTMRAPSEGSDYTGSGDSERGTPQSNEWDRLLDKDDGYIKNWNGIFSCGQDTVIRLPWRRTVRGHYSSRFCGHRDAAGQNPQVGFRPVLEVLNRDTIGPDGLKTVTLDLGGGKLGDESSIRIIVKNGSEFTAPASDGLTRPEGATGNYFKWLGSDGKLYAPGASVPEDVTTLTARFVPDTYTVIVTTDSLPDGKTGKAYSHTLTAIGAAPITWSIDEGALPAGLRLNEKTGEISGIPTAAGTATFTVKAENSEGSDTRALSITVNNAVEQTPVRYLDADGKERFCTEYTVLESVIIEDFFNSDNKWYDMPAGWYVVEGDVTITPRLDTHGAVNLILTDDCHLTVPWGINVKEGDTFTIYAQSTAEASMGKLTACLPELSDHEKSVWPVAGLSGIGAGVRVWAANDNYYENEGTIIINGGNIHARGQQGSSAIGGSYQDRNVSSDGDTPGNLRQGGSITINGGIVCTELRTSGGAHAADSFGIGTCYGNGGSVTINGGTIIAEASSSAISSGRGGSITINGGNVTAHGGINRYENQPQYAIPGNGIGPLEGGSITINGGTVKASTEGDGFGIGGAGVHHTAEMHITINGGNIETTANRNNAAIGDKSKQKSSVTITDGVIHAVGKGSAAGIGSTGDIRITGGEISAFAEGGGAAIGSIGGVDCKSITINGNAIKSLSSKDGACIGAATGGSVGSITISDAELPLLSSNKILIGWDADSPGGKLTIRNCHVASTDELTTRTDGIRVGSNSELVIEESEIRLPHFRSIRVGGNGSIAVRDSDLHTYGIFMDENAKSPNDAKTLKRLEITDSTVLTGDIIGARGEYSSVEEIVIRGSIIRLNDEYTYNRCTIGGGEKASFGSIDIQDSQIDSRSSVNAVIGNGTQSQSYGESRIRIANSQVSVRNELFGPAIGAAYGSSGGQINILIENSTVTAKGGNLRSGTDYIPGIGKNSSGRASEIGKIQILNSTVESFRLEEKDGTNYVYDKLHTKELPGIPAENITICGSTVNGKTIDHSPDEYGKCALCDKYDLGYCYEHGLLTLEGLTDCAHDGSEKKLTGLSHQTGENKTKQLTENTDYTAIYSNNVHPYTLTPGDEGFDSKKAPKVTLYGTGNYCGKAEHYFTISENAAAAPTITTDTLPGGKVGEAYSQTLTATGTEPIIWSIISGELPKGLTLKETTGEISGTPTAAGTSTFTVKAANITGSGTKKLGITIKTADPVELAPVPYLDADGKKQVCTEYTVLESFTAGSILDLENKWYELPAGWYVVEGDVTITPRLDTHGAVNLILKDGSHLTAEWGVNVKEGDTFTVYAQSTGEDTMGKLTACLSEDFNSDWSVKYYVWPSHDLSGIGAGARWRGHNDGFYENEGTIIINGGNIRAKGQDSASAIGGPNSRTVIPSQDILRQGGTIIINGGTVRTEALEKGNNVWAKSVGIGTCQFGYGGSVTINGGTVIAEAACDAITTGKGGTITINGGDVTAHGGIDNFEHQSLDMLSGNGIGPYFDGTVTINGGHVKAFADGKGCGIGGHRGEVTVTITGGTVEAVAANQFAAIGGEGSVTITGGVINAAGKNNAAGIGSNGDIRITGGEITVSAEGLGAAIGGYAGVDCGNITIQGNVIKSVISSGAGACIGGASNRSAGSITISNAKLPPLNGTSLIGWIRGNTAGSLTIRNCYIESTDTAAGSGIQVSDNGNIRIENSEVKLPEKRDIRAGDGGSIVIRDSTIHSNGIYMLGNLNEAKNLKRLEITGSTVVTAGNVIGAMGSRASVDEIVIHGSSLSPAEGADHYYAIGGGEYASFGSIDIQGSQINIPLASNGAAIGGGNYATYSGESTIRIANSQVTAATGARLSAAIGTGNGSQGTGSLKIFIESSDVTAKGGPLRQNTDYVPGIGKYDRITLQVHIQVSDSTVESFRHTKRDSDELVYDDLHEKNLPGIPAENISICGSTVNGTRIDHSPDEYGKCALCGKYDIGYCYEHGLLTMEGLTDCVSDGSEKKLTGLSHQTGENETKQLAENTDYTASYSNNVAPYTLTPEDEGFDPAKAPKVTLYGTGNYCGKAEHYFTISENAAAAPSITTSSLPDGKVGEAYSQTLTANGTTPIKWSISGALPDGLSLNKDTGKISGTPTADGTAKFTVTAENSAGSDTKELSITITKAPAAEYTVTVTTEGDGTASASPAKAAAGTEITLSATPDKGYHLKEWQVESPTGLVITNNKFTMPDSNVEVKAIFEEDAPPAPTNPAKPSISVTGTYTYNGSEHTAAVNGYDPSTMDIAGNTATDAGDYTVRVTSKTGKWVDGSTDAVTAAWSIGKATQEAPNGLTGVAPSTEGGSDGKITGVDATMEYRVESETIYTACAGIEIENLPAGNYFVRYAEDHNHFASPDAEVTVGKGAPLADCTITFDGNGGSGSMGPVTVKAGANYILPECGFTAPADQEFKAWEISSTEYKVGDSYTVLGDTEIKALWENSVITPTTYTVTVSNDGNGTGTATPSTAVAGTTIILTATPNTGYHFKEWQVISGGVTIKDDKFLMPNDNVEVKAIFEKDAPPAPTEFTITVKTDGNGTASASHAKAVVGTEIALTATPNKGYHFKEWRVISGGVTIKDNKFTMSNDNVEVKAIFEKDAPPAPTEHTVTVTSSGNGTASASPAKAVAGAEITLTATPDKGYHLKEWQVISGGVTIKDDKFLMPNDNVEVKAIFEKDAPPAPTEFIVTFDGNGGTSSVGSMTTTNQKLTSLPSASRSGSYSFDGWYTEKSGGTKITTDTVFSANTTVYAHWTYTGGGGGGYNPPVTYYTLRFETGGGSDIPSVREAYNTYIDLTKYVPTWRGHTFIGWYTERSLMNKVSGVYLTKDMTVYAGWRVNENPGTGANPFTDVSEKDWFYSDVMFVYENGLMLGTSKTLFSPHGTATRGMMATILWRMEGSPVPKGKNSFTDVEAEKWYADAITWTAENGIFAGYGKDKFGPDDPITREQLAAIFYRYADYKGYDLTVKGNLDKFKDADKITDYAKTAMQWAVGSGLMKGKSGNLLDPQGTATRAEIAAMLHRFIEKYELVQGKAPGGLMGWIDPKRLQIPKTGDSSTLGLWGFSLCTSLAGCLVLTTWQIRRRREEEALQIIEK